VLGLSFLALELFVLPGFGVFGVGGIALLIGSIVLASQTFVIPQNAYQFEQFPRSLLILVSGGVGLVAGLIVLSRFLDRAPVLRQLMLPPPPSALRSAATGEDRDYARLLHQRGVATTPLLPSGKARFGSLLVDVVSDGVAIDAGTPLEVVQVVGHRVVVRAVA
jgi:membrane-bound ClpP family serine protease